MANVRCWVIRAVLVLLAALVGFPLATIFGQLGTIDPDFLSRIAILTAGIAGFLLALLYKDAFDKLDAMLEIQTGHKRDPPGPANDDESFIPGQCGMAGCRKMALTGARACREHLCRFCQTGWK